MKIQREMQNAVCGLKKTENIMDFMDIYINYGCVHANGNKYVDSLGGSDFYTNYRTLGLEESLEQRLGACIEQANIARYILVQNGVKNRMFCIRGYNDIHKAPNDLYLVHCFVLSYFDDKVFNIEHSDTEKRGIYQFATENDAIYETNKLFQNKFLSHGATSTILNEYFDYIPNGLSFSEFNRYINENSKIVKL